MKPLVSSIVALAIAIAPAYALAAEKAAKPVSTKIVKHKKTSTSRGGEVVRVKHGKSKPEIERARHVDAGHKGEPKVDHGVTVIPASLTTKPRAHDQKPVDAPKLPNPNAHKNGKNASEKGARKPTRRHDDSSKDGQTERDEEFAELVARIRGNHATKVDSRAKKPVENAKCWKDPIEIIRGAEVEKLTLTKCDGTIAPLAVEHLSVLVRPGSAPRPVAPYDELAKKKGPEIAKGIHRVDGRLVERLQSIVDHFHRSGATTKIDIVSGYRPTSAGSMHASGRAIDFRIEGAKNDDVVAFCKTLDDTGCGFYPNSSFVHVDVRDPGAGHVTWIDASGPGENPRYVTAWPPRPQAPAIEAEGGGAEKHLDKASLKKPLDREAAPEPVDEHPPLPPPDR